MQDFVKNVEVTRSPLLQQIQELSLDQFEFGQLIGQGCNAAVYEACLKNGKNSCFIESKMCLMYILAQNDNSVTLYSVKSVLHYKPAQNYLMPHLCNLSKIKVSCPCQKVGDIKAIITRFRNVLVKIKGRTLSSAMTCPS